MRRRKRLKDKDTNKSEENTKQIEPDSSLRRSEIKRKPHMDITPRSRSGLDSERTQVETITELQKHFGNKRLADTMANKHDLITQMESSSQGKALPESIQRKIEGSIGKDLKGVRIHHDSPAAKSAKLLQAKAYTRGPDVYFGKDNYSPETSKGMKILTHELTHVIQTGGNRKSESSKWERPNSAIEKEAQEASAHIFEGHKPVVHTYPSGAGVLRMEEEAEVSPTMTKHAHEIIPAHKHGTINAGPFSVVFYYEVSEGAGEASLVLQIPDGVSASFSTLSGMPPGGHHINDPGGDKARTVRISLATKKEGVPRIRAMFSQDSTTYIVIFQFPLSQ